MNKILEEAISLVPTQEQMPKYPAIDSEFLGKIVNDIESELHIAENLVVSEESVGDAKKARLVVDRTKKELDSKFKDFKNTYFENLDTEVKQVSTLLGNVSAAYKSKESLINIELEARRVKQSKLNISELIETTNLSDILTVSDIWENKYANKTSFNKDQIGFTNKVTEEINTNLNTIEENINECKKLIDNSTTLDLGSRIYEKMINSKNYNYISVKNMVELEMQQELDKLKREEEVKLQREETARKLAEQVEEEATLTFDTTPQEFEIPKEDVSYSITIRDVASDKKSLLDNMFNEFVKELEKNKN